MTKDEYTKLAAKHGIPTRVHYGPIAWSYVRHKEDQRILAIRKETITPSGITENYYSPQECPRRNA